MFAYRTPGVYFEWQDPEPPVIGRRRTDIAGFVGIAASGPLHHPVRIESWTQFVSTFGAHIPQGYLAYAVEGFFANGGHTCYVVRVANPELASPASLCLRDGCGNVIRLTATSPGTWGQAIEVLVTSERDDCFALTLRLDDGQLIEIVIKTLNFNSGEYLFADKSVEERNKSGMLPKRDNDETKDKGSNRVPH